jgi:hypothetical protein
VASLSGADQPTASGSRDQRQAALNFAKCMRQHGINMPDPKISGTGRNLVDIVQEGPTGVDQKDPRLKAAQQACQRYLPTGSQSNRPDPWRRQREVQFARCMRQHGIDMPDPGPDGGFVTHGDKPDDQKFKAAWRPRSARTLQGCRWWRPRRRC